MKNTFQNGYVVGMLLPFILTAIATKIQEKLNGGDQQGENGDYNCRNLQSQIKVILPLGLPPQLDTLVHFACVLGALIGYFLINAFTR